MKMILIVGALGAVGRPVLEHCEARPDRNVVGTSRRRPDFPTRADWVAADLRVDSPPEDVGGTSGYFEFLRVLLAPDPDEADEQRRMKRWSGGRFDSEKFDLAKTDRAVRNALRRARS